jgi:Sortase domain
MSDDHEPVQPAGAVRPPRRRRLVIVAVAVVVAAVVAVTAVELSSGAGRRDRAAAASPTTPSGSAGLAVPGAGGGGQVGVARSGDSAQQSGVSDIGPSGSTLVIPSLKVDAPLTPTGAVGAPETASLTIPSDIHAVAWWDGKVQDGSRVVREDAPRPGQAGVALIAGHIDSAAAGPGALYDLKDLTVGDTVEVIDSHHHLSTWRVSAPPDTTLKTELPASLWVTTGAPKLALVTCGGPFDSATGHYLDNVIVWARPANA